MKLYTDGVAAGDNRWTCSWWFALAIVAVEPLIVGAAGVASCQVCVVPAALITRSNTTTVSGSR